MQIPAGAELGIPCYEGSVAFDFMMDSFPILFTYATYVSVGSPPGFDRQNFWRNTKHADNIGGEDTPTRTALALPDLLPDSTVRYAAVCVTGWKICRFEYLLARAA